MPKKKKAATPDDSTRKATRPEIYDADIVRAYARGRWADILSRLGGIPSDVLDGKHHPCPKPGCASRTDAFRFTDMDGDGSIICNQCCHREAGNGFKALEWITGKKFYEVVVMVAEYLGIPPSNDRAEYKANGKHNTADPAEHLAFQEWDDGNEQLIRLWLILKPPITIEAVRLCGARIAMYTHYEKRFKVIALPVWGESLTTSEPVGWSLYNITGGPLPGPGGKWVKIKLTYGSTKPGFIGPVDRIAAATEVWKLEGPSDLLAFWSLDAIPSNVAAVTNKAGCGERPAEWMLKLLAGKRVYVLHDADEPGQRGENGYTDERGRWRPGWLEQLAAESEAWHVQLPFEVTKDHGKDLRDFLCEVKT